MSEAPGTFRWSRFASAERELAFRRSGQRADARIAAIAFTIIIVNLVLFAATDFVLFGPTAPAWALLALRTTCVVVTVLTLRAAGRARTPGRMDALHLALSAFFAVTMVVLDSTRPRSFVLFIGPEAGLILGAWVFLTARFAYQAIAATLFTAGIVLTFVFFRDPLSTPGYLAVVVTLVSPHIIGSISSWRLQRTRRLEWLRAEEVAAARSAAEAASRSKSLFLGMVSHEVLAPLGGIVAAVESLGRRGDGEPPGASLEAIGAEAAALRDLLADVLDLARGEAVEPVIALRPTVPATLVAEVERTVEGLARAQGLRLECSTARDIPARVALDPGRVRQVLLNLATNAIRCTERGSVEVRCERFLGADGALGLRFVVSDTGPGISEDELVSVFEPFWQRPQGGAAAGRAGLGLAVARLLADRMGGRLAAESRPEEGSRFTLTLSNVEVLAQEVEAPAAPAAPLDPALAAEARALAEVPHAGRARAFAALVEAHALSAGDAALARWAGELRDAAARLDAAALARSLQSILARSSST